MQEHTETVLTLVCLPEMVSEMLWSDFHDVEPD